MSDRICLARAKSPAAKLRLYSSRVTISNRSSISPRVNRGNDGSFERIRCTSLIVSVTSIIACLACSFFRSAIVRGDTYEYNSFESGKTGCGRRIDDIGGAARITPIHCNCKISETNHVTCLPVFGHIFACFGVSTFYFPVRQLVRTQFTVYLKENIYFCVNDRFLGDCCSSDFFFVFFLSFLRLPRSFNDSDRFVFHFYFIFRYHMHSSRNG